MKKCECGCSGDTVAVQNASDACSVQGHAHDGCGCGHAHTEEHSHDGDGDGCGCSHGNADVTTLKQDVIAIIVAVAIAAGSFFAEGMLASVILVIATLVVGLPIFREGVKNILRLNLEELALMTIAVTAAVIIGELPEALLVTLLFRIGNVLEDLAVSRSRREVEAVTNIIPENANLLAADGSISAVGARTLAVGSRILVKPGERVPVDCTVLEGVSSVDTSSLTGESAPREVQSGDAVLSGSVNMEGVLTCETTSSFDGSTASKIVAMVRDSAAKKGRTERLLSRFARVYTPIVIVVAILVAVVPPLLGAGSFTDYISRALVFLVASCPCALVIAVPLSFFAGIGAASKNGILIKGSKYIEALAQTDAVVFDKTGTLTTGRLSVAGVYPAEGHTEEDVLALASACESFSNHPIAKAVVEAHTPDTAGLTGCEEITAYGMRAQLSGEEVLCGAARLMERFGVDISALPDANVYVARGGVAVGAVAVYDHPREDAAETLTQLGRMGVRRTAMLTGDGKAAAEKTARETGIGEVHAGLLPAGKVSAFEQIKNSTAGKVAFVGDGINDSPVIAQADAGIAMGLASDAAIEAADVVLLSDKLSSLPQAVRIARRTARLARFNIAFALLVKLAVFVLAFFGVANMGIAVFADVGVTVLSVLNATRALYFR